MVGMMRRLRNAIPIDAGVWVVVGCKLGWQALLRDCYPKLGNSDYSIKSERTRMRALVGSICVMAIVHRHHQDRRRRGCVNLRQG